MKGNYLYWLGAGASFYSLPIVSSFNERLDKFQAQIKAQGFGCKDDSEKTRNDTKVNKKHFVETIDWLLRHLKEQASVDTFAKKLFFKNAQEDLHKLKAVLSCFFVGEQSSKTCRLSIR